MATRGGIKSITWGTTSFSVGDSIDITETRWEKTMISGATGPAGTISKPVTPRCEFERIDTSNDDLRAIEEDVADLTVIFSNGDGTVIANAELVEGGSKNIEGKGNLIFEGTDQEWF